MSEPTISVIIPVRNEAAKIEQCLEAVFPQSLKPYEVIVVDGHSTDGTVERAQKFPVKVLYEDYHTRGGACQVGIENAASEYVAFTDADCIPDRNWLQYLVNSFEKEVVGVGGQTRYNGKPLWGRSIDLAFATLLGSANSVEGRLFQNRRFVNSISGCNSIYRKQDVLEAGGFNTGFVAEDTELSKRLLKRGKLLYIPTAIVVHEQEKSLKGFAKRIHKWGQTRATIAKFNLQVVPPLLIPLLLLSLLFTRWILIVAIGIYLLAIIIVGAKFAIQEKDFRYLLSIPIVFVIEHSAYTVGFWKEVIKPRKKGGP